MVVAVLGCAMAARHVWYLTPSFLFVRWRKGKGPYEGPSNGSLMEASDEQGRRRDMSKDGAMGGQGPRFHRR